MKWWLNRVENLEPLYQPVDDNTDLGTLVHAGLEVVARATMSPDETFKLPTGEENGKLQTVATQT